VLEEIIVTADFRQRGVQELPASVTILDAEFIEANAVQHFEELIDVVPNLNWSGDGHRARYFQIRGVGELEQYQGAPNPSIGFLIDDIDFSGIGTIATLFDVASVEVLRGSQGSRYGANALGGLIYMKSTSPTPERAGRLQLMAGNDDALGLGLAFGGALDDGEDLMFRISAQKHESNGFRSNSFLARDDTNRRDEASVRLGLRYEASPTLEANLSLLYGRIDNGYDAFALDNGYVVLSDKPGKDAQDSLGASLRIDWSALETATVTSITSLADSDIDFSFDADWGNDSSWAPVTYDYVSLSDRTRRTASQEIRVASNDGARLWADTTEWLVGLYLQELKDELLTLNQGEYYDPFYDFADSLDDRFGSDYTANNTALFGQIDSAISDTMRLGFGLRIEHRSTDYRDTAGLSVGPSETMWGGELSLSRDHSASLTSFVSLTKGYKAGGFNLGAVPEGRRSTGANVAAAHPRRPGFLRVLYGQRSEGDHLRCRGGSALGRFRVARAVRERRSAGRHIRRLRGARRRSRRSFPGPFAALYAGHRCCLSQRTRLLRTPRYDSARCLLFRRQPQSEIVRLRAGTRKNWL